MITNKKGYNPDKIAMFAAIVETIKSVGIKQLNDLFLNFIPNLLLQKK